MTRRRLAAAATAVALIATGCGPQLEDLPFPSLVDGDTYTVTAEFADALNLPVDAPVKLDGATVGQVREVSAGDYVAEVEMSLSTAVELRRSTTAEIRLTSPMGTAFIELFPGRRGGRLADGGLIPASRTSESPDITDLLSALSTLVTGGSFGDISTIVRELNIALTGNAGSVRSLLRRLDSAITDLNGQLPTLDRLTRSLDRLTSRLRDDLPVITRSLTDLSELVTTLDRQRGDLMRALGHLRRFDAVATPLTRAVREDLIDQVGSLRTVMRSLLRTRSDVDGVMRGLIAFSSGSDRAAPGDFANFDLTFLFDPETLLKYQAGDDPAVDPRHEARR